MWGGSFAAAGQTMSGKKLTDDIRLAREAYGVSFEPRAARVSPRQVQVRAKQPLSQLAVHSCVIVIRKHLFTVR